jgi:hypothetical protein
MRWSKGQSRIKAYNPQGPRIPVKESTEIAINGIAQQMIIAKE